MQLTRLCNRTKCADVHQEEEERKQPVQKPFKRGESVEKANVSERKHQVSLLALDNRALSTFL